MIARFRDVGIVVLTMMCGVGAVGSAWGQMATAQPGMSHNKPAKEDEAPPLARAPALPGSQPSPATAAPSTKSATDMSPNDALFDAIDRGDVAGARDALKRGADLNAHNVLGMTPLDLSVDLGRNDISFLLLSMRGEIRRDEPNGIAETRPKPSRIVPAHDTKPSRNINSSDSF